MGSTYDLYVGRRPYIHLDIADISVTVYWRMIISVIGIMYTQMITVGADLCNWI